jgi:hypothetical protein
MYGLDVVGHQEETVELFVHALIIFAHDMRPRSSKTKTQADPRSAVKKLQAVARRRRGGRYLSIYLSIYLKDILGRYAAATRCQCARRVGQGQWDRVQLNWTWFLAVSGSHVSLRPCFIAPSSGCHLLILLLASL